MKILESWDPIYKDVPPVTYFDLDSFTILEGESVTTTCVYNNKADEALEFPAEMCTTIGIIYPAEEAFECYN